MKILTLVIAALILSNVCAISKAAAQDTGANPILAFRAVSPGIYRGARPGTAGMKWLAEMRVKTDLDLDDDTRANTAEAADAERFGVRRISIPMSGFFAPKDEAVSAALQVLANPSNYPIFVHCHHGEDRTGLIVALYRWKYQNWTPANAYREMLELGFHKALFPLNHYFEKVTGYDN